MNQIDPLIVGSHDVGIAIQNAVVAAESLGLGTVDIGAIRIKSLEVTKELNLPKYVIPLIGLCVGYPDDDPAIKPRMPMSAVFFEDKYDTEKAKAGVDEYDEIFKKYLLKGKLMQEIAIGPKVFLIYILKLLGVLMKIILY